MNYSCPPRLLRFFPLTYSYFDLRPKIGCTSAIQNQKKPFLFWIALGLHYFGSSSRRYFRSGKQNKRHLFCFPLTYSYLCSCNWFTFSDEKGIG